MKQVVIFLFTLFYSIGVFSQNTTLSIEDKSEINNNASVLIIPFEDNMFMSDVNRALGQKHGMTSQEIKNKFRIALDRELFIVLKNNYKPLSFYSTLLEDTIVELGYIYNSIGYSYELVPEKVELEKEGAGKKILKNLKKKPKKKEYIKAGVFGGEIVTEVDNREKYMKTTLLNKELLPNLNKKLNVSNYIFINQLDIKRNLNRGTTTNFEYNREVKVHYTIFDNNGKVVSSGIVMSPILSRQIEFDRIISIQFSDIAKQIVANMVGLGEAVIE